MMNTQNNPDNRRTFLKKTAVAAAAASTAGLLKTTIYGQNQAPSAGVIGANNRIAVAYVGVGGQGMAHVRSQKTHAAENNIVQAAVCDVYQKRLDAAREYIAVTDGNAFR